MITLKQIIENQNIQNTKDLKPVNFTKNIIKNQYYDYLKFTTTIHKIDSDSICIVLQSDIIPASRPRSSKFGMYIAEPYKTFKEVMIKLVREELLANYEDVEFINRLQTVSDGNGVSIGIKSYYPIPKSYSKKKRELLIGKAKLTKPDTDNIGKSVLDALTESKLISDDNVVSKFIVEKLYSESNECSTYIHITIY